MSGTPGIQGSSPLLDDRVLTALEALLPYARRWAVRDSPAYSAAVIYDAAIRVLARTTGQLILGALSAIEDRRRRYGEEPPGPAFEIPATQDQAVIVIQRFARRDVNRRGINDALTVNNQTRVILEAGFDLTATIETDGTLWALSRPGTDDGLTDRERAEATDALARTLGSVGT